MRAQSRNYTYDRNDCQQYLRIISEILQAFNLLNYCFSIILYDNNYCLSIIKLKIFIFKPPDDDYNISENKPSGKHELLAVRFVSLSSRTQIYTYATDKSKVGHAMCPTLFTLINITYFRLFPLKTFHSHLCPPSENRWRHTGARCKAP